MQLVNSVALGYRRNQTIVKSNKIKADERLSEFKQPSTKLTKRVQHLDKLQILGKDMVFSAKMYQLKTTLKTCFQDPNALAPVPANRRNSIV